MKCYLCESELIWNNDFSYEDYMLEGDGIVTELTCPNDDCGVERVVVYNNLSEEE